MEHHVSLFQVAGCRARQVVDPCPLGQWCLLASYSAQSLPEPHSQLRSSFGEEGTYDVVRKVSKAREPKLGPKHSERLWEQALRTWTQGSLEFAGPVSLDYSVSPRSLRGKQGGNWVWSQHSGRSRWVSEFLSQSGPHRHKYREINH